jgi:hypothetical protein
MEIMALNFKKVVSTVVVFSLVLCSCGGNKDRGGHKVPDPVARYVQTIYTVNDGRPINGPVLKKGATVNLKGVYEECSL